MGMGLLLNLMVLLAPAAGGVPDRHSSMEAARHLRAGEDLLAGGDPEGATAEFHAAIELDPLMPMAHYNLGQAYMSQQRYGPAADAFIEAIATIGKISGLQQKRQSEIERTNDDMIRELKESIRFLRSPASKLPAPERRITMLEERIRMLENMKLRRDRTLAVPAAFHLALGSARFRLGEMALAEQEYLKAAAAEPQMGEAHSNLAVIYMLTGRFDAGREAIRRAEAAGFAVHPGLKRDLEERAAAAGRE